MKVYQPLETKDSETGLFYRVWEAPDGMPQATGLILVAPDKDLMFPKYNSTKGIWEEDITSLIEDFGLKKSLLETQVNRLKDDNATLKSSLEEMQATLLDAIEMISGMGDA